MRSVLVALVFFLVTFGSSAQAANSVANTTWRVEASWMEGHIFFWVFDDHGKYKDTDGPTGTWTQKGNELVLQADAGWTYRCTLTGDTGVGKVYRTSTGKLAGTLTIRRVTSTP